MVRSAGGPATARGSWLSAAARAAPKEQQLPGDPYAAALSHGPGGSAPRAPTTPEHRAAPGVPTPAASPLEPYEPVGT